MRKFKVRTLNDSEYTVTMNGNNVADVNGLPPSGKRAIETAVEKGVKVFKLEPLRALGRAIGPYSTATEVDAETTVSDLE